MKEDENENNNEDNENEPPTLLTNILSHLIKGKNGKKWIKITTTDLYVNKLKSAQSIVKRIFTYEMDYIAQAVSEQSDCKPLFPKSCNKSTKVNILSKYFGDKTVWYPKSSKCDHKEVESLCKIAKKVIFSSYYPKTILADCVSRVTHEYEFHEWKCNQSIPISMFVTSLNRYFKLFAYPEKLEKRNQIEARTFDPTHIVTNLHVHLCKNGFQKVRSNAFREIYDQNNELLSRAIVYEEADKQSIEMALKVFSEEVENYIRIHGDSVTADFVGIIRCWFYACDESRVSITNRLQWLVDMNNYMNQFYDVFDYPPPSTHIYNLPIQTFEMIMQATSMCIALYLLSDKHKFNN